MDIRYKIARRYLFSERRISMISVITGISMIGVSLGVAALVVVLSVLNGFFDVVRDMMTSYDPHVRIIAANQRGFENADSILALTLKLPEVEGAATFIEGKAILAYDGSSDINRVVIVRGIENDTTSIIDLKNQITIGDLDLGRKNNRSGVVIGANLGNRLGLFPKLDDDMQSDVSFLSAAGLEKILTQRFVVPPVRVFEVRALFEIDPTYDANHVYMDIDEAGKLFRMRGKVSGIELRLENLDQAASVKEALMQQLPADKFLIQTWYDLQKTQYDVMRLEKWGATAILILIVLIAAFNIIGSLTMIVIEKRRDIGILQAMGMSRRRIREIFLLDGLLIGMIGSGTGLIAGLTLALLQQNFGLVRLPGAESFIIDAYPVSILPSDIIIVFSASLILCILAAIYPAIRAANLAPGQVVRAD